MKNRTLLLILVSLLCVGAAPSRSKTYTSGEAILSSDVTSNEDAIFTYLQNGVDTIKDGVIVNSDISGSANIQSSKLNLSAVDTVTITSSLTMTSTTSMGWTVQAGANEDCNTTCTKACIFGFDDGLSTIVPCTDETADKCVCGGSS